METQTSRRRFATGLLGLVMVLGVLALGACGGAAEATPRIVGEEANGTTVTLRPGQDLIVRLAANPTTGYGWMVVALDEQIVTLTAEPGFTPETSERVGAGGIMEFRFRAQGKGSTTLRLEYRRPFEPATAPPAKVFTLNIEVK